MGLYENGGCPKKEHVNEENDVLNDAMEWGTLFSSTDSQSIGTQTG